MEGNERMSPRHWHLYTDGASRGNPGPAGLGAVLMRDGKVVAKKGCHAGKRTNNQAEYLALLLGLYLVQEHAKPNDQLSVFADSELLVRQMLGAYKVRNEALKPLQQCAYQLLMPYEYGVYHIYREENQLADDCANAGIDKKVPLPTGFLKLLRDHAITL